MSYYQLIHAHLSDYATLADGLLEALSNLATPTVMSTSNAPMVAPTTAAAAAANVNKTQTTQTKIGSTDALFDSLIQAGLALNTSSSSSSAQATANTSATSVLGSTTHSINAAQLDRVLTRLLRKDQLLQETVDGLLAHQRRELLLNALYAENQALDAQIISFVQQLEAHENKLYEHTIVKDSTLSQVLPLERSINHTINIEDLLIYAQKLGGTRSSYNLLTEAQVKDDAMAKSLLRIPTDRLVEMSQAKQREEERKQKEQEQLSLEEHRIKEEHAKLNQSLVQNKAANTQVTAPTLDLDMGMGDSDEEEFE